MSGALQQALEQHVEQAQEDTQRWLSTIREKVAWSSDTSGDKYSIETKMSTVRELLNSVTQGEEKVEVAAVKAELLQSVTPGQPKERLEEQKRQGKTELRNIVETLTQTQ